MKKIIVLLLLLFAFTVYGADVKISNLPATTTLEDTDVVPVVAGTTTSKITVANLKTLFGYHAGVTLSTTLGANLLGLSTQQLTLDDQMANYVFAGPTTGEAAAPSFRALVAADIPSLVATYQPLDATLTALAAQTESEGAIQYYTAAATPAVLAKGTAYQLLNMNSGATAPTWTSTLGATDTRLTKIWATDLELTNLPTIGGAALTTILQPLDGELTALAGLTSSANAIPYFTGSGTAGVISSSADMVALLGSADYATALTNLGGWGVSGTITDEQLVCAETTGGTNLLKSCGAKITYTEPASNTTLCRTGSATTGACTNPVKLASFAWDGNGSAVATASSKRCTIIPTTATVTGVYAIADASTTTHIHVYQDAFATGARSTTVTGAVDISATLGSQDTTLTGWDKSITAGDEICMSVEANDNAKWLTVTVYGTY